jgi:restriction endonuclease
MEFDYTILEERFKQLPEEMQLALSSPEIAKTVKEIGAKHGLMIDQESILFDQVSYVMLGLAPAQQFVKNLSQEASLAEETAKAIAAEINADVLDKIKDFRNHSSEAKLEEDGPEQIPVHKLDSTSAIERAGQFEIERSPVLPDYRSESPEPRRDIVKGLEGAISSRTRTMEENIEPLVDQLLRGPSAMPAERVDRTQGPADDQETTPKPPANLPTGDPYRENLI